MKKILQIQCILAIFIQNTLCTIDVDISEYTYLSQHLTPKECRRLYASLHFSTYDLPPAQAIAEKAVPIASCMVLLKKWDKGTRKNEGTNKSHVDVARRLAQIGRPDLAKWLRQTVLTKLVDSVNDALETKFANDTFVKEDKVCKYERKVDYGWNMYDSIMLAVLGALMLVTLVTFLRLVVLWCRKIIIKKKVKEDEVFELLSYGSVDSDQETLYNFAPRKKGLAN